MTLVYFILILGITILIHEVGHYLFAKRAGIYVHEFALGMGPTIFSKKRKNDETIYSIRLIPIGGYVQLAGESIEEDRSVPKNKQLQAKTWSERLLTIIGGATFNFLFAIMLLFIIGLFWGVPNDLPIAAAVEEGYPAYIAGVEKGDMIIAVSGKEVDTWDEVLIQLELNDKTRPIGFTIKKVDGSIKLYNIKLKKKMDNKIETYRLGIVIDNKKEYGLFTAIKYSLNKTKALFNNMYVVISNLITGNLGINKISGPVGIYGVVGREASAGFNNILYLMAFLSINVGFVNLVPFPAFDGGRVLFLVIEKIKGSPIKPEIENYFHTVGFFILIGLMLYITFNDIIKLF